MLFLFPSSSNQIGHIHPAQRFFLVSPMSESLEFTPLPVRQPFFGGPPSFYLAIVMHETPISALLSLFPSPIRFFGPTLAVREFPLFCCPAVS